MTIDNRDELIYALTEIAELEHVLLCQYLFTAATMKEKPEELSNDSRKYHQIELIKGWKLAILRIAREEMQHLTYANNLLVTVGGAPYFVRSNFPSENRFYKSGPDDHGLPMSLEPFRLETVERYIRFETSEVERVSAPALLAFIPDPNYYETLHEFYSAIRDAFTDEMIIDVSGQYDPVQEGGARVVGRPPFSNIVKNSEQARKLIDEIMLQGEGASPTDNDPRAHVNIFKRIQKELLEELRIDPAFQPGRNVVSNPLIRLHADIPANPTVAYNVIPREQDDGLQYKLLQLFAGAYQLQLIWLKQIFAKRGPAKERRAIETLIFLPYMSEIIRPLSEILTLVPSKLGSDSRLGPTFEVTSNNFLLSSDEIGARMTIERIRSMETQAEEVVGMLKEHCLDEPAQRLAEVKETCRLLREEFASRVENGWPLDLGWPSRKAAYPLKATYSEDAGGVWLRPTPAAGPDWSPPSVVELEFAGWAQCRLATDPDGAFSRRGVTGNAFAVGSEPDLDRLIRLQPHDVVKRSHCPEVGVHVTSARLLKTAHHAPASGTPLPELIGARVNLLDNPTFEGRNHLVAEDGEPIDPFEIEIRGKNGIVLRRRVIGPSVNQMSPEERRGTGRFPLYGAQVSLNAMRLNAAVTGLVSPAEFMAERIQNLERDLMSIPEAERHAEKGVVLRARLGVLRQISWSIRSVRWTRFFFDCEYFHSISGAMSSELGELRSAFQLRESRGAAEDPLSKWLIHYNLGFYDTDALAFIVRGVLRIPVIISEKPN